MRRVTNFTVLRWLFTGSCLLIYWGLVGDAVVTARRERDLDHWEWMWPSELTLPWSLIGHWFPPPRGSYRGCFTALTVGGALLNGFLFAWAVQHMRRSPARPPDPQAADYDDTPPPPTG
jgi:hypothetical protein